MFLARRLLLAGELAPAVAEHLHERPGEPDQPDGTDPGRGPDLELRVLDAAATADDLAWADSFSGVAAPPGLTTAGIRWVHTMAAGVDGMVAALTGSDVVLTRTIGSMPRAIGTHVLAHVLPGLTHVADYRAQQDRHEWRRLEPARVERRRAVVLGTGEIGAGVAEVLRAVGFAVTGLSRSGRDRPGFDRVVALADGAADLVASDLLVLALPLTESTRGLVGPVVLGSLRGAVVVNVGRGATLDPGALRAALDAGSVRRAVLDVVETEPLPAEDWRWDHPGVTLTPHVSGPTEAADIAAELLAVRADLAAGRRPPTTVDLGRGY
ncbi:NAD(P)-dependent oxidoreductase [Georgenia muralis]|uniref:Phosphoglycerate dehydrogenase-like enzyme n=1 Tax=Georgenia muralis TaxID=154117 RepID=A0A3N5A2W1_9MICO|nr:NAD(P)-dependent oxidoreductase [Georgenia muralis]RPF26181.1 phosphoglycerate dehydrogenase-like enzyme [Georgenia muralis]